MSGWQPIATAPRDGTPVLLYVPGINIWNRLAGMPYIVVGIWTNPDYLEGWYIATTINWVNAALNHR